GVLERAASTVTPQPVMAVVGQPEVGMDVVAGGRLVVVCAGVGDPGNAGTVLRAAEAAGADAVVVCAQSVDVYNPKCVRASAGSLFHVPVVVGGDARSVLHDLGEVGLRRLGTVARAGTDYTTVDLTVPSALVLGNEAGGLPADLGSEVDEWVTVPMEGRTESLNVGMAAAVLCFEAARQRRAGDNGAEDGS
ncbi:MAG: RNA methyltransferase, partial [Actinomycetota bacterium]|nr:RNA methyltransferase [Actinomycetota bacterium]